MGRWRGGKCIITFFLSLSRKIVHVGTVIPTVGRLRLLDGRPEPGIAVDMGEQRAASGAGEGLVRARRSDRRVRTMLAARAQRRDENVLVLGRRVQ